MAPLQFKARHPHPEQAGCKHLYKFAALDDKHLEYAQTLLENGRLYHALPGSFNDPWEAKPWVRPPEDPNGLVRLRNILIRGIRSSGRSQRQAERAASKALAGGSQEILQRAIDETFGEALICCLSASKDNLLLWSHYAVRHTGYCIEFDARKAPFSFAYKVFYQENYPSLTYPLNTNASFSVLASKSKVWEYENEFRVLYIPSSVSSPGVEYNDNLAKLPSHSITAVYFGACMSKEHLQLLSNFIEQGPFNPELYKAKISRSRFEIEYTRIN